MQPILRRALIVLFGIVPATPLAFAAAVISAGCVGYAWQGNLESLVPLAWTGSGLGGYVALWWLAFSPYPPAVMTRVGLVAGILAAAGVALLPAPWWWHLACLSPVVVAVAGLLGGGWHAAPHPRET